jgi:hypothetical protein
MNTSLEAGNEEQKKKDACRIQDARSSNSAVTATVL